MISKKEQVMEMISNKVGKRLTYVCGFIIVYILLGLIIPVILKFAVFENTAYSLLSNDGWASFLGSYVGGVLGGLGTLIAMYVTIKQSFEIQAENKRDTDIQIANDIKNRQMEYNRAKADRDTQRKIEQDNRDREIRRQFADDIAELLGKYITDISKYHFSSLRAERLDNDFRELKDAYRKADNDYKMKHKKVVDYNSNIESDEYKILSNECDFLAAKRDSCYREYEEKRQEIENNSNKYGDRLAANTAYFIMKTKLYNVPNAENLVNLLNKIHRESGIGNDKVSIDRWPQYAADSLMETYGLFRLQYV